MECMNVRGDTKKDRSEFWWKVVIYSVIGIVVVGAIFNSFRERMICPSAMERKYIESVDATIILFAITNMELYILFRELGKDPELFTDDSWRWLASHYAKELRWIGNEFSREYPSSEETEMLGDYEFSLKEYARSASDLILQALKTNDQDMLWEGNLYRIKAKASADLYIDGTIALWPECSISMGGPKSDLRRETYISQLPKPFLADREPPVDKDQQD